MSGSGWFFCLWLSSCSVFQRSTSSTGSLKCASFPNNRFFHLVPGHRLTAATSAAHGCIWSVCVCAPECVNLTISGNLPAILCTDLLCVFFSLSSVDIVSFFKSYECWMFNKIVFCPLEGGRGLGRRTAFCSLIPPDLTSGSGAADFCWHDVRMGCCGSEIVC